MATIQYEICARGGDVLGYVLIYQEKQDGARFGLLLDHRESLVTEEFPPAISDRNIVRILLSHNEYHESFVMRKINQSV